MVSGRRTAGRTRRKRRRESGVGAGPSGRAREGAVPRWSVFQSRSDSGNQRLAILRWAWMPVVKSRVPRPGPSARRCGEDAVARRQRERSPAGRDSIKRWIPRPRRDSPEHTPHGKPTGRRTHPGTDCTSAPSPKMPVCSSAVIRTGSRPLAATLSFTAPSGHRLHLFASRLPAISTTGPRRGSAAVEAPHRHHVESCRRFPSHVDPSGLPIRRRSSTTGCLTSGAQ